MFMDIFKSNVVVGIGAAVVATVMAPVLIPAIATVGRPLAKSLVKNGLKLYEKSREAVASAGEVMEDLIAEVRAEEGAHQPAAAADIPETDKTPTARSQGGNSGNGDNGSLGWPGAIHPAPHAEENGAALQ
jgi:hypothetical protein